MSNNLQTTANQITLNSSQSAALYKIVAWLATPKEDFFILEGAPGTGKSTMVSHIVANLDSLNNLRSVVGLDKLQNLHLTATTHEAATVIAEVANEEATTIHKLLGLSLNVRYQDGVQKSDLIKLKSWEPITDSLIVVDEGFNMNRALWAYMGALNNYGNKILIIGDPDQLIPYTEMRTPIPDDIPRAELTINQRVSNTESNALQEGISSLRELVRTGSMLKGLNADGISISHLSYSDFENAVISEFSRTDWKPTDSRILAWSNKEVLSYDSYVAGLRKFDSKIASGDVVYSNAYHKNSDGSAIRNNTKIFVAESEPENYQFYDYVIPCRLLHTNLGMLRVPDSWDQIRTITRELKANNQLYKIPSLDATFIDLRFRYATTVDKAQGATIDTVFVDLDSLAKCRSAARRNRLLYVALSRARTKVIFTGSIKI